MNNDVCTLFPGGGFIDLTPYQCGMEQCAPSHSFGPAKRNHYLFHYIVSGSGMLMADDVNGEIKKYHIKSGDGFMIFPQQVCMYVADNDSPWEYMWVEFDGLRAKKAVDLAGLTPSNPIYTSRSDKLREKMAVELSAMQQSTDVTGLETAGHLYLFLNYLINSASEIKTAKSGRLRELYINDAVDFIEKNFQNHISVEDMASVCGLNRSYFGKLFKENVGKTPQEFLLHYRMAKAAEMLILTKHSISEIGISVGYDNGFHFSRAFKSVYGISPREWRVRNRTGDSC
ncbi:MAG: AraC family transcriptional regulator [Clostridia bacterium]|nr:AraC family transcriptional regulator [Clostridia bacterium]